MKRILAVMTACILMMNSFLITALANAPDMPVSVNPAGAAMENQNTATEGQGMSDGDQGAETKNQGADTLSQSTDTVNQGTEEENKGTGAEKQSTDMNGQGAGVENQAAAAENQGGVTENQGAGAEKAPEDTAGQETDGQALQGPQVAAPSVLLMEASTGTVIFEKNADEARNPASVTKIMTLILIFDAIQSGKIKLTDEVVTSAHAKSMGGSQVFLEEGEIQTVETLIKCIVIASGNDASVAMSEYIAGDEGTFVQMMNDRAKGLGMTNTHFEDCCGLTDSGSHVTTARDIALMSRELITKYPEIFNYSTIWMENITHVTKQGTKEFGLSNTNKLLKMATNFEVTGLKTGSTSVAKYCLSATARKDGVQLIAAIMAAPDYKVRFADAVTMLNYGYANCKLYEDKELLPLPRMSVKNGVEDSVELQCDGTFSYLSLNGEDITQIAKELVLLEELPAPVTEGQRAGQIEYTLNGKKLGEVPVLTKGAVEEAGFTDYFKKLWKGWLI